ncbi:2-C-methyl-D-erythritol 4-phosphate cytidylyltransferase [Paraphotobacterium marinum]|uniref:2-C-methyl-D-erythritol 4-phosphate cytidylyltransferase n=1 Tax=Paraphotobacterium marinum TaxID=1755811 RepID=A0A220VC43_9GAMM|nr:2-C-methyl-D-erythritol 4-phosphate cytidylyltransferase [Paraphotobacterium marinum]ASK77860.1 2-C-methyl-D-erythritol 4-phosphate cytidylyltransferase [Paraphotobacterium marinum]
MSDKKNEIIRVSAVIVAAGVGSRMSAGKPKQYIKVQDISILEHTINIFIKSQLIDEIYVVISREDIFFDKLGLRNIPNVKVVYGGKTRSESVLNGLLAIKNKNSWALIHDAVRPCLKTEELNNFIYKAINDPVGGALVTPVINTLKHVNDEGVYTTVNRNYYQNVLTPQIYKKDIILNALKRTLDSNIEPSDESFCIEHSGLKMSYINGKSSNIKITYNEDLLFFEFYLNQLKGK